MTRAPYSTTAAKHATGTPDRRLSTRGAAVVDELVAFLNACLDEDGQAARKAAALCGCHPEAPSWSFGDESTDGRILVVDDPHPGVRRKLGRRWNGSYEGLFMAEHIVRHDPARVLREIEAKRQMVKMHGQAHECVSYDWVSKEINTCMWIDADEACTTLRLLALPYSDRPGYAMTGDRSPANMQVRGLRS